MGLLKETQLAALQILADMRELYFLFCRYVEEFFILRPRQKKPPAEAEARRLMPRGSPRIVGA